MILSSESILNINPAMTNEIKSILRVVPTLETKWDLSGFPAFWNTILFKSWKNEDDT